LSQAILHYQKALTINPNNEKVYNNLGTVYFKSGQYEKAVQNLEKAIQINPKYSDAHYNLGAIYQGKGQNQKAKEHFKQACDLGAEDACQILRTLYEGK